MLLQISGQFASVLHQYAAACLRVCICVCVCVRLCVRLRAAVGMVPPGHAVLYSCVRVCYICLRTGGGSDGNTHNVVRGLRKRLASSVVIKRGVTHCTRPERTQVAVQWLGVMPCLVSKSLSSRATRYTHCRPSPSPTVNVYSTPACQGRARLDGSSRRPAPTPTCMHKHDAHTRTHTRTRAQARARDRAP